MRKLLFVILLLFVLGNYKAIIKDVKADFNYMVKQSYCYDMYKQNIKACPYYSELK